MKRNDVIKRRVPKRRGTHGIPPANSSELLTELLQLEDSHSRYETIVSNLLFAPTHAFYVYNHRNQKLVLGGDRHAALYGYTEAEIEAMPHGWGSVYHPDDHDVIEGMTRELIASDKNTVVSQDVRIRRKDGSYDNITLFRRIWERDDDGIVLETGLAQLNTPLLAGSPQFSMGEATFQGFMDQSPDGLLVLNDSGVILAHNACFVELVRIDEITLVGSTISSALPRNLVTKMRKGLNQSKREHSATIDFELAKGQRSIPVSAHFGILPGGRTLVQLRDMTERVRRKAAEKEQESFYKGLFENNSSAVVVFDRQIRLEEANPALLHLLDLNPNEIEGLSLRSLIAPRSKEAFAEMIRNMKENRLKGAGLELNLKHHDGNERIVHASPTPFFSEKGRFERGILILTDVTKAKKAQHKLREESKINDIFFNQSPMLVAMIRPDGRLMRINPAGEALFGFKSRDLEGKVVWDLPIMDPVEVERSRKQTRELARKERSQVQSLLHLRTKKGEIRSIESETVAVEDPHGDVSMLVATGVDITERKRLESEVIRVAEQEQIRIGHDLHDGVGQILTGAIAMTEALMFSLDQAQREDGERILELLKQAHQDTRQLSHGLTPSAVKDRGLAGGLAIVAETVRQTHRIECTCKASKEIHALSTEAETHLFRIAQESVSNAIRHGRATKIDLTLQSAGTGKACLEIVDNGIGFDVDAPRNQTGIGLRVMNYRSSLIGSDLKIVSGAKTGTRVICYFPSIETESIEPTKRSKPRTHSTYEI